MKAPAKSALGDTQSIYLLPRWISRSGSETPETVAFSSGAALALLDMVVGQPTATLPSALQRDRLALQAAVACLKLEGRSEAAPDIRDAICLARAGDALGPAGEMFTMWRKLARINLGGSRWQGQVANLLPDQMAEVLSGFGAPQGSPVAQAVQVLADSLQQFPRQEAAALMLGEVALARAMRWDRVMPLLAAHLKRSDVRTINDWQGTDRQGDPLLCVHRAMVAACDAAIRGAADLSRRASKLAAIAPKLRAKGAENALGLFLSHDAVSPSGMLSPTIQGTSFAMTDRAARRLCDRLVDLGVVRELTGRSTFRLYGI